MIDVHVTEIGSYEKSGNLENSDTSCIKGIKTL